MINSIIFTSLVCSSVFVINKTKEWNHIDSMSLETAKKHCIQIYSDAPCLKKFIKKSENNYWAICGKKLGE